MAKIAANKPILCFRPLLLIGRLTRSFRRNQSGAAAIEFGIVGLGVVTVILAILQYSILFLSQVALHDALSDVSSGLNSATLMSNKTALQTEICKRLLMADDCSNKLKLEMQPLASYTTTSQAITGALFLSGVSGNAVLLRAQAPVVVFVPGVTSLMVRGAALYVKP